MKKFLLALITAGAISVSVSAMDLTFRIAPGVILPQDKDFSTGFGGFVQADVDLFGCMTVGVEGNYSNVPAAVSSINDLSLAGGGLGLGFYYSPFSRVYLGVGGAGGVYQFSWMNSTDNKTQSASDLYYRGYGELGFRVTPEFTISATGGYINYLISGDDPLLRGKGAVTGGISFRFTMSTNGASSAAFGLGFEQDCPALPVFMNAYRTCPLGNLTLSNNESSEIRNVRVGFRAGKYTSETFESAKISRINRHSSENIDLCASFSSEILKYAENGKISGEIVVDYELLGKKKQAVQNIVIDVYNRNGFLWSDPAGIAAFISGETPEVQQVAKTISGMGRNSLIPGMNQSIQFSAAIFEGLRLSDIKCETDKTTPYKKAHLSDELDSIQFPLQTLEYKSGDLDDVGILYASCLESSGIPTGFLITDDDFIVLVGMNVSSKTAINHFASTDGLIMDDENVYFGVSMANFAKGFAAARKAASKTIAAIKADESKELDYMGTAAGWETYKPAVFSGTGLSFDTPSAAALEKAMSAAVNDYINTDLAAVIKRAQKEGDTNKLGIAYLRSGRLAEAKAEFSKLNNAAGMNNLANCYMIEKNYTGAKALYKKVLAKEPENKVAISGLADVNERLGVKE